MSVLFLASVPVASLGVWWAVASSTQEQAGPLRYEDRAAWRALPTRRVSLSAAGFLTPPGDAGYRDVRFHLTEPEAALVGELASIARRPGVAPPLDAADLPEHASAHFYGEYLLGDRDEAIRKAPAVLVLRFVEASDTSEDADEGESRPAVGLALPPLEFAFARTTPDALNDSLRLVFTGLVTDGQGRVYLPIYKAPLRLIEPSTQPRGRVVRWPLEDWHEFPGQVGTPRPFVVRGGG